VLHLKPRHCPPFTRPKRRCLDVHALVSLVDGSAGNANEGRDGCRGNVVVAIQELTGTLLLMQTGVVESGASDEDGRMEGFDRTDNSGCMEDRDQMGALEQKVDPGPMKAAAAAVKELVAWGMHAERLLDGRRFQAMYPLRKQQR